MEGTAPPYLRHASAPGNNGISKARVPPLAKVYTRDWNGFLTTLLTRPINKQANDKQTKKKPTANDKASTSHASGEKSTPTSNAFDVLNSEEGAEFGDSNPIIETAHVEGDAQNLKSAAKKASKNNPRSSPVVEDSEEDEVYCSNAEYTSRVGSGFSMDEDDLDGYDGYEAQVYDIPERLQTYCDGFDIRLNSRGRK
ncbi:hypothetical protein Tco_1429634 [Tanacetum coccineum]